MKIMLDQNTFELSLEKNSHFVYNYSLVTDSNAHYLPSCLITIDYRVCSSLTHLCSSSSRSTYLLIVIRN